MRAAGGDGEDKPRGWLGSLFHQTPKNQMVRCFECNGAHEVSSSAQSSICKDCGAYIDLQDYKISGSFSRNIVTRGTVTLAKGGDLSSSKVVCSAATIMGRMRGNLVCSGRVTLRTRGKMSGTLEAGCLVVEKGSEVEFTRPVRVSALDVSGIVSGPVFECDGHVTIQRTGILRGPVRAKGFTVEKDGGFEGELTISPRQPLATVAGGDTPEAMTAEKTAASSAETLPLEPRRLWAQSTGLIGEQPSPG